MAEQVADPSARQAAEPGAPARPAVSRDEIDRLLAAAQWAAARAALGALWAQGPTPAAAGFVNTRFEKLRGHVPLAACRLAVLRSFTVEPIVPLLRAMAFLGGIDLTVQIGDFNTWSQDILDPAGPLYRFSPDVVILAAQTSEVAPALWDGFADLERDAADATVRQTVETYRHLVRTFRSRSTAHLIVHTLQSPPRRSQGILDAQSESGQSAAFAKVNDGIAAAAREHRNVYVLDYNALLARRGADHWRDERKWLTVRLPIAGTELIHLAREWLRFLHPLTGRVCKALAVDLDNTMWGGVIGEDGLDGIKLGDGYPGAGFRNLQRAMLDLYRRGVLLAVCSKNNPPEAMEALSKHPGMLLKPEHFAAFRINWTDKAQNIRDLARELNIGVDAVAFLDDNPVERQWVQAQLPEVTVIDLPPDPLQYADALRDAAVFERLSLSDEDRARGRFYAEQRMRADLMEGAGSVEDFYRSLDQQVDVEPVTPKTIGRAAQLTQKTNQFNMTTRRYTEQQMLEMREPAWRQYTVRVRDRFGDNGIVGVAVVRLDGDSAQIDTLLLSCRVIGRTVETALLSVLAADAAAAGARRLIGTFVPTRKNAPAKDVYKAHGFAPASETEGSSVWELPLPAPSLSCPPWIKLTVGAGGGSASNG